jgi:hypothetical protein
VTATGLALPALPGTVEAGGLAVFTPGAEETGANGTVLQAASNSRLTRGSPRRNIEKVMGRNFRCFA